MTSTASPAYIAGYARTPIGRAYRGAFNDTDAPTLAAFALRAVLQRHDLDPHAIDDVILGCALPEGSQYYNIGRMAALAARLPVRTPGMTVDRQCASGLMSVAIASQRIQAGDAELILAGGVESISLVQTSHMNTYRRQDRQLADYLPAAYMPMVETAEVVATRYGVSREGQDAYALESQRRAAMAQAQGLFEAEIAAVRTVQRIEDRNSGEQSFVEIDVARDECPRPTTSAEGLAALSPVFARARSAPVTPARCPMAPPPAWWSLKRSCSATACNRWGVWSVAWWKAARPTKWASARCRQSASCCSAAG